MPGPASVSTSPARSTAPPGLWHAAFYHKTFKWPSWDFWERWIRRTAGIAKPPRERDPARYDATNAHCDLLIVGGGPAGLLAAQVASRSGLSVILAEQDFECGGRLLATNTLINEAPVTVWFASLLGELAASRSVKLLTATTCFGLYDHGMAGLLQRLDLGNKPAAVRQRYWRVHARQTLLATGAIEQPLVFAQNDLPGILLAGAVRQYANRYGVSVGKRIVLATNNDSAYLAALDLVAAGAPVKLVLDCRVEAPADLAKWLRAQGVEVRAGASVAKALGRRRLERIVLRHGRGHRLRCARRLGRLAARRAPVVPRACTGRLRREPAQLPAAGIAAAAAGDRFAERLHVARCDLRRSDRRSSPGARPRRTPGRADGGAADRAGGAAVCRGRRAAAPSGRERPPVARPAARRHGGRCRDRARGGLRTHRAPEALHDLRHGRRPGQDFEPQRAPDARGNDGEESRRGREHDLPPPLHAGHARRARRAAARRALCAAAPAARARGARGARRALVGGRRLDAPRLLPAQGRIRRTGRATRGRRRARGRRPLRRLAARQDRSHRPRRGEVPRPLLRQQRRKNSRMAGFATA